MHIATTGYGGSMFRVPKDELLLTKRIASSWELSGLEELELSLCCWLVRFRDMLRWTHMLRPAPLEPV